MQNLRDKLVAAGIVSESDARFAGLSLSQLTALRSKAIVASLKAQGSAYNRSPDGTFRSTAAEQAELAAINAAIRKLRKA